jgi:hypothetical protein
VPALPGGAVTLAEIAALLREAAADCRHRADSAAQWGWGGDWEAVTDLEAKARDYEAAAHRIEALAADEPVSGN